MLSQLRHDYAPDDTGYDAVAGAMARVAMLIWFSRVTLPLMSRSRTRTAVCYDYAML